MPEDDYTALTKERLTTMAAESKIGSDAIGKSLRCYPTKVHPILLERLSVWWDGLDRRSITEGKTFTYDKSVAGLTGSNLMNYVFQSFYDQEPGDEVEIIYPRLSTKTSVVMSNSQGMTMRSEVEQWIGQHQQDGDYDVVGLRMLAEQELGLLIVQDLLDNTLNSSFSQSVRSLLESHSFHFPSHQFVTVADRKLSKDLLMKIKYYPSRDDNRAYCSDHNRLRSLVASCLNRMVLPKRMSTRLKLHSASILRPDKKDVLDLHLRRTPIADQHTYLILADISNFTGSLANAWLMVYTMGLELAQGKLEDRYQLFSIGGKIIEASWKELIMLYLYLTVGVPCWIEEQSRFGYLSGGFLGVGGNITIGLLCLAVVLEDARRRLMKSVTEIRIQAGGDDIAVAVTCAQADVDEIVEQVRYELEAYVGKLKELDVYCLDDVADGVIDGATFCRKRIILKRRGATIHMAGEPSVPLPISLFPETNIHGIRLQIRAWHELDASLRGWESKIPGYHRLTDTIRQLFLEHYRRVIPMRTHWERHLTSQLEVLQYGNTRITASAHMCICSIYTIKNRGVTALSSYESKVRHALINEVVVLVQVNLEEGVLTPVVMLQSEICRTSRTRWVERLFLEFDEELLVELMKIVG